MEGESNYDFVPTPLSPLRVQADARYEQYVRMFQAIDTDGNGSLDRREFFTYIQLNNPTIDQGKSDKIFRMIDTDHSGTIKLEEFIAALSNPSINLYSILTRNSASSRPSSAALGHQDSAREHRETRELTAQEMSFALKVFQEMDQSKDNRVSLKEMTVAFKKFNASLTDLQIRELFMQIDEDNSGEITINEFLGAISASKFPPQLLALFANGLVSPAPTTSSISGLAEPRQAPFEWEIGFNELKVDKKLGEGAFGVVYLGTWQGAHVAIKELRNMQGDVRVHREFQAEISIMSKLRHPNIVLFLGASIHPPNLLMVTEYCRGGSLGTLLKERRLRSAEFLKIALHTALGLNYLHLRNPPIVHRDLKPDNILLDETMNPKLADFGLSQVMQLNKAHDPRLRGTPMYMAPEIFRGEPWTSKLDVYAYALLLHECVYRKPLFNCQTLEQLKALVLGGVRPVFHFRIHQTLIDLISGCWHDRPEARPDMAEIIRTLSTLLR